MAITRGKLTLADESTVLLVVTAGDKIRAGREKADATTDERITYAAYLAARRTGAAQAGELGFDAWLDTVLAWDPLMDEMTIREMLAVGEIDDQQADRLRALYGLSGDEPGETVAGPPTTSPASPSAPDSPSEISATPSA